jgi:hypothetical protein
MCTSLQPPLWETAGLCTALAANTEFFDKAQVSVTIVLGDVAQQTAATANHLQQAATSHKVVLVHLEVLGQFLDALRKDSNLGARATGVSFVCLRAFNGG